MVISKDIHQNHPTGAPVNPVQLIVRSGTLKAEGSLGSEEEMSRPSKDLNPVQKADFVGKVETADNIFMEDVSIDPSFALSNIDVLSTDHFRHFSALRRGPRPRSLH